MKNNEGICMSDELAERAKIIADATGRTVSDVLEDLGDDGILNESNRNEKDLITQLKEAAELISTVKQHLKVTVLIGQLLLLAERL